MRPGLFLQFTGVTTRFPWGQFPPVLSHVSPAVLHRHPQQAAARQGDLSAARAVVAALVPAATWTGGTVDYVCPVLEFREDETWNALPLALAESLAAQTGAQLVAHVVRARAATEGPTESLARLLGQSGFEGSAPAGRYLICTDEVRLGSNLANLRGHLIQQGADVLAAVAIAANVFSTSLVPDPAVLLGIYNRFRHDLSTLTTHLGFDYDRLTAREAFFVYGLKDLECFRNPAVPSHRAASLAG